MATALLVLEREAAYRAETADPAGAVRLPVRDDRPQPARLLEGYVAIAADPFYDEEWRAYIDAVRARSAMIDFADLVYLRSELVRDRSSARRNPTYEPAVPPLFGEKEGKIARASRGRDPLYLFAALQRQLGYPEVPRLQPA